MAKVTVEMTRAEYQLCCSGTQVEVNIGAHASLNTMHSELERLAHLAMENQIARAVRGDSRLSDHVRVDVEIVIVN